jgi:aldehyde dehydrogenase (NAD+)
MATAVAPRIFKNFINGEWVESRSGKAYENRNPANSEELIGMFVSSTEEDADAAVDAAKFCFVRRSCSYSARKSFPKT